jgi:hypothetical protein
VLNVGYHYKLMILFNDGEITTEIAALLLWFLRANGGYSIFSLLLYFLGNRMMWVDYVSFGGYEISCGALSCCIEIGVSY